MKLHAIAIGIAGLPFAGGSDQAPPAAGGNGYGPFEGDLAFDAAHDELDGLVEILIGKIDTLAADKRLDAVDIPGMRANIVILTTLVRARGGGQQVTEEKRAAWAAAIEGTFRDESRWGSQPWPQEEKDKWHAACQGSIRDLESVVDSRD